MYQQIKAYIDKWRMLSRDDIVIAGISGGADSICLLFVLSRLGKEMGFTVTAVHVNHGIRGKSAADDEKYVRQICERLHVGLEVFHENVKEYAKMHRLSEEEAGREVRRNAFEQTRKKYGGTKIALAHHQNDNAETLLWNLCRGTGLRGMGGIAPAAGVWIRPLLGIKRGQIEKWLDKEGIAYCTDETNLEDHYTRNKIRNHVIPYLEEHINSQSVKHMAETMVQMRELQDYIDGQVECYIEACTENRKTEGLLIKEEVYIKIPGALRLYVLHGIVCQLAGRRKDIEVVHARMLSELWEKQVGRKVDLPYGISARRCYEGINIFNAGLIQEETANCDKEYGFSSRIIDRTADMTTFPEIPYTKWFDYDIIKNTVKIRHRMPGDYITINRDGGTQKLKQYFINEKIPQRDRDRIWLVADGNHVMWIVGYRQNQTYQITDKTSRILEIEFDGGKKDGRDG